jgi:hypothetical protein
MNSVEGGEKQALWVEGGIELALYRLVSRTNFKSRHFWKSGALLCSISERMWTAQASGDFSHWFFIGARQSLLHCHVRFPVGEGWSELGLRDAGHWGVVQVRKTPVVRTTVNSHHLGGRKEGEAQFYCMRVAKRRNSEKWWQKSWNFINSINSISVLK